jgi:ABC-2 type transport system ATP-binding protein
MIKTQDLGKQFNGLWAVDGLTLSVGTGQVLALLGQNGAGKTTTVRLLTALLRPSCGWAMVAGFDVVNQPREVRSSVGVLTEQHGLYVRMTALEYLEFFGRIHGLDPIGRAARSRYLLDYFDLSRVASGRIGDYSKGMRQKLALARALMHGPPVLLLDEPTSAMDPESARLVRDEIARLRSAQRTIVICTHNLAEAEALADIVAIMYHGHIIMVGTADEVKRRALGIPEYEARLSLPWNSGAMRLPDGVTLLARDGDVLRFGIEEPGKVIPELVRELAALGAPLMAFQEVPRTLEQAYLRVMDQAKASPGGALGA